MQTDRALQLPDDVAVFLRRGLGVIAASRDAALGPSIGKGLACRLDADANSLTVFLVRAHALQLLADVEAHGVIAVTCSQPSTHRTLQFKGENAREVPLAPGDEELVHDAVERYVSDLSSTVGFPPAYGRALTAHRAGELVAISFTVRACFDQTPGPRAGESIAPAQGGAR